MLSGKSVNGYSIPGREGLTESICAIYNEKEGRGAQRMPNGCFHVELDQWVALRLEDIADL